jgi:hypothetical protein
MPTLTFPPPGGPCGSAAGGARTGSDARCPRGGGVSRSYAQMVVVWMTQAQPGPRRGEDRDLFRQLVQAAIAD